MRPVTYKASLYDTIRGIMPTLCDILHRMTVRDERTCPNSPSRFLPSLQPVSGKIHHLNFHGLNLWHNLTRSGPESGRVDAMMRMVSEV